MGDKMKKTISAITIGVVVAAGIGIVSQFVKGYNSNNAEYYASADYFDESYDDEYDYTDDYVDEDVPEMSELDWTLKMIEDGDISQEEGEFHLAYAKATTEEEKQKAYENFVDYLVSKGEMTKKQGDKAKTSGHDSDYLDELFLG